MFTRLKNRLVTKYLVKVSEIPAVTKLSDRVIRILGQNPNPMTLQGTNTYLIGSGSSRLLIDCGDAHHPEYIRQLRKVLEEEKVTLNQIIITHWHADHIGGVQDILDSISKNVTLWKFPRSDAPENYNGLNFQEIKNNQQFVVEGAVLRAIHTPGHTTDHVILQFQDDSSIFSGDCILGEGTAVFEDLFEYMKSLKLILGLSPPKIYPGHGNIIEAPTEKIQYYIQHRNEREQQILDVLKQHPNKSFTINQIVKVVYSDLAFYLRPAANKNVAQHLVKLVKDKLIREVQEDGCDTAEPKYQILN